jgi:15-cis-phytoene synthase
VSGPAEAGGPPGAGGPAEAAGSPEAGGLADVGAAYAHCELVARRAARNFYYGIRLLPKHKRRAICAIYAFARRIDDIGDGTLDEAAKLRLLDEQAQALGALGADSSDPVMIALADAHVRFGLPLEALGELIEGVRMDVDGGSYQSFEDLQHYCRCVAGTIGRLCVAVFGSSDAVRASALADDIGIAMQLTNIVRDVREDAVNGRVYLPAEDFERYHLLNERRPLMSAPALTELARKASVAQPAALAGLDDGEQAQLYALLRFQVLRANDWFGRGMELLTLLDRRSAACVLAMTGIYRRLLQRVAEHPDRALAARMSLPVHEKALLAVRGMMGRGVGESHPAERLP